MYTEQMTQGLSIAAAPIDPVSQGVGTVNTGGIDMEKFRRSMFVLQVGSVGAAGTVNAKLQESADNIAFTDVAGGAINPIITSNKVASLEIRAGQLSAGKRYIRLSVTVAVNAVQIAAMPLGGEAVHKPGGTAAGGNDVAAVAQRLVI